MAKFKPIGLGDRVKDPVSGFNGIITCVSEFLHGYIRIGVAPEGLDKEGKPKEDRYFDQSQLVLIKAGVHKPMILSVTEAPPPVTRRSNGGPAREGVGFRR